MTVKRSNALPDITNTPAPDHSPLDWVGMTEVAVPFSLQDEAHSTTECEALASLFVNICRSDIKGIHMSRLYLLLAEFAEQNAFSPQAMQQFLHDKLATHKEISDQSSLTLAFDYLHKRPALLSQYQGWKAYPAVIKGTLEQETACHEVQLTIPYSSTCPCSASLSRQLLEEAFRHDFADQTQISADQIAQWLRSERGSVATPHSQRSYAYLVLKLAPNVSSHYPLLELIDLVEQSLGTPVQTAVKREDEQAFARLNGANLMFCEDAARRIKRALEQHSAISDFWVKVEHQESLHAHNAVAIATKGCVGGYRSVTTSPL
ncbi:GTP cyclohydrolase FolE2 [Neptunomonas sp. XY-337]|uniref:GTP cyclohydrolase FolE2 n=1 Tax=Neptunomonas sp. XY-337 TaxID=2561897 RepID=UPI0010AB1217|nr:GTP cyclohydrolase FolE2 [Neptunomonas sp. XY-337]